MLRSSLPSHIPYQPEVLPTEVIKSARRIIEALRSSESLSDAGIIENGRRVSVEELLLRSPAGRNPLLFERLSVDTPLVLLTKDGKFNLQMDQDQTAVLTRWYQYTWAKDSDLWRGYIATQRYLREVSENWERWNPYDNESFRQTFGSCLDRIVEDPRASQFEITSTLRELSTQAKELCAEFDVVPKPPNWPGILGVFLPRREPPGWEEALQRIAYETRPRFDELVVSMREALTLFGDRFRNQYIADNSMCQLQLFDLPNIPIVRGVGEMEYPDLEKLIK